MKYKPCRLCGSTDIGRYKDRTECKQCTKENSQINYESRRARNIEHERKRLREWTRKYRAISENRERENFLKRQRRRNKYGETYEDNKYSTFKISEMSLILNWGFNK